MSSPVRRDLLALLHAGLLGIIVERAGQRGAEGGEMGAAVALRDVVGEAEDLLVVAVVPPSATSMPTSSRWPVTEIGSGISGGLGAVEIAHEGLDAAFVIAARRFSAPRGGRRSAPDARRNSGRRARAAVLQRVEVELGDLEGLGRGQEGDLGALLAGRGRADHLSAAPRHRRGGSASHAPRRRARW
jgi:hypothetical protein